MCCTNIAQYAIVLLAVTPPSTAFIDPLTLGTLVVGSATVYKLFSCKLMECCDKNWISADFVGLESDLAKHVFGQHLMQDIVVKALRGHFRTPYPKKALSLSFHGLPGVGKNYVGQFITNRLYKKGAVSQYFHFFTGKKNFPLQEEADIYRMHLQDWIRGNVSSCGQSVFLFDEVDKMPRGVLDGVKPFLDYHVQIDGVDFRKAVFIFISNTGGHLITRKHLELWESGKKREDFRLRDFEDLIKKGAFNEKGGFHRSETIESDLIDHYIPFLPLEESHVKQCIREEFRHRGVPNPQEDHVEEVLKAVTFGPEGLKRFSNTGCKRIGQNVVLLIEKLTSDPL